MHSRHELVYSSALDELYKALEQSLAPRGPGMLCELALPYLNASSLLVDAGCGTARHSIELVQRSGCRAYCFDPVEWQLSEAARNIAAAGLSERMELKRGGLENISLADAAADFIWCRDVLVVIEDLKAAMAELYRVLQPGGHMLVYVTLKTQLFSEEDERLINEPLGNSGSSMERDGLERAFAEAGFAVLQRDELGGEWREYWEESGDMRSSHDLLLLSRLRRSREALTKRFGLELCRSAEAALSWGVYQLLGRLCPTVYLLGKHSRPGKVV
jgi:SAM-dependent methyltransferase